MEIVNPLSSFIWHKPLDIYNTTMMGVPEKQGWSFSRHGWLAAQESPSLDADAVGKAVRQQLRPLSRPTLNAARERYKNRDSGQFPKYFIIEPSASCNRKCPFCPIIVTNRKGFMKWETFMKLMRECGEYDTYGLSLYQLGESFLWKGVAGEYKLDIADMVQVAKDTAGFKIVNISTNGDVKNLSRALECDLDDLIISIDGTTQSVYDANRPSTTLGDVTAFDRTVARVKNFLSEKAKSGHPKPFVRLQIINKENTRDQILDFIRQWIIVDGVDDVFIKNLDSMRPWLGNTVVSDEEDSIKAEKTKSFPCQHIYSVGSMTVDGSLNACCHDALTELTTAGANINSMTFSDWWNGEFMTQLRSEHNGGHFRIPCAECRERDTWLG